MQQASSTANEYQAQRGSIGFHIAQELPPAYATILTSRTNAVSLLTKNFSEIAQAYNNRDDMVVFDTYCDNCTTSVQVCGVSF